jgi:hypothetical protein
MSPSQAVALTDIAARLDAAGLGWGIFAGTAIFLYTRSRAVTDIDILVRTPAVESLVLLFPEGETLRKGGTAQSLAIAEVDLVPDLRMTADPQGNSPPQPFEFVLDDEMLSRRVWHGGDGLLWPAEVSLPVLSPEDNLAFKAILQRGPERGKHDLEDVQALVAAYGGDLDWNYVGRRAQRCGALERVQDCLARMGIPL